MPQTAEENKENSLLNLGKQILDLTEDQQELLGEMERMSNKEHTSQRLSELKEKVEGLKYKDENIAVYGDVCYNEALNEVLQLIDNMNT